MNSMNDHNQGRILVIDDNRSIHEDFRKILSNGKSAASELNHVEAELFGESGARTCSADFEIDSACQGREGLALVRQALERGRPYNMAFVDVRMPPGWDGIETATRLWSVDPGLQIVICTAHSDYSWEEMRRKLGISDRLLILKKPFDNIEVLQMAHTLTEKWRLSQEGRCRMEELESRVQDRTRDLQAANEKLQEEVRERIQTEAALRNSEERYRLLFQDNPHAMWIYDLQTLAVLTVNDAAVHQYGHSREEFLTLNVNDIWPEKDDAAVLELISKQSNGGAAPLVCMQRKKDGTSIEVELSAHNLNLEGRPARLILAQDITERKNLELQLRHSQKMEAVGCLAGGVAHDFNNLLTVIIGSSEFVLDELGSDHPLSRDLQAIRQSGRQAASLTRQLLAFSRRQILEPETLDLNALVTDYIKLLRRLIGEDIQLVKKLEPDLRNVQADPGQLEQVLMNLAVNARDAMPKGGTLTVETTNVYLDEEYAQRHVNVQPGWYAMVAVGDTGCGMDAATQSRIFEPFFTTKEAGKGTGLGLSTVYGIIKQSGGHIWVDSELGKGTAFKVYLPCVDATPKGEAVQEEVRRQGSETVLVVEDEEDVRKLACRILLGKGYHVLESTNTEQALLIAQQYQEPIHLILSDVIMPRMSGPDLIRRMAASHPEMKILYMSGYTDDAIGQHGVLDDDIALIPKPFTPRALTHKVREVLDAC